MKRTKGLDQLAAPETHVTEPEGEATVKLLLAALETHVTEREDEAAFELLRQLREALPKAVPLVQTPHFVAGG